MKILQGKWAEHIETGSWHRVAIRQIEDLGNAVLGADLEAVQMSGPRVGGSLAFAADRGVVFSSGLLSGKVTISGPLSHDAITLGVGLRFGPGSRHWLNEVLDGAVSVVLPGDEHDAYYTGGTLYLAATLTSERLQAVAEREELALDRSALQCSGLHSEPVAAEPLAWLRSHAMRIHQHSTPIGERQAEIGAAMLRLVIDHYVCVPDRGDGPMNPKGRARIVHRAREYIRENLAAPITPDILSAAAGTSRRTLERAFREVLEDSPYDYVRRLRLHRIRRELVTAAEAQCTISRVARRWRIREPGRFAGWYSELFGEAPSTTLAYGRRRRMEMPL